MNAAAAAGTASRTSLFGLHAFMRFWYSRLAGTSANQMLMVAIGWQMYELTGSAWDLGLVGLLQFLPALLLVLIAGHVVDRCDRARIVSLCMLARTAVALLLAVSAHRHGAAMGGCSAGFGRSQWRACGSSSSRCSRTAMH